MLPKLAQLFSVNEVLARWIHWAHRHLRSRRNSFAIRPSSSSPLHHHLHCCATKPMLAAGSRQAEHTLSQRRDLAHHQGRPLLLRIFKITPSHKVNYDLMRPYRAPLGPSVTFFAVLSWAGCITNMSGFDLRQAQGSSALGDSLHNLCRFGQALERPSPNPWCRTNILSPCELDEHATVELRKPNMKRRTF